jgi:hypothetical protein
VRDAVSQRSVATRTVSTAHHRNATPTVLMHVPPARRLTRVDATNLVGTAALVPFEAAPVRP